MGHRAQNSSSRMISEFLFRVRNAPKELRWRGPLRFSLLVLREIFSPLFYWHVFYVFEKDVHVPPPDPAAEFDVEVYAGREHLDKLIREIAPMGEISAEEIAFRLTSGDVVAVAYAASDPVGCAWMALKGGLEIAFDTVWVLAANEAAFHGSFTRPNWRGRSVQRYLDAALLRYAHENGVVKIFLTISALNAPSIRAAKHMRKQRAMTLVLARIRRLNWVYRKAFGAPLESRFAVSPPAAARGMNEAEHE